MPACTHCTLDPALLPTTREHHYIPPIGCIVKTKPPPLPPCTCPPPDPNTGAFTHDPNCPRHQ